MIPIDLAIDEEGMRYHPTQKRDTRDALRMFSDLLARVKNEQCTRWKKNSLYDVEIEPNLSFSALLYDTKSILNREERHALQIQIDQCKSIDDEKNPLPKTWENVKKWQSEGRATACLILESGTSQAQWAVWDEKTLLAFYRAVPEMVNCSETDYIQHAARAFPGLYFKPGIENEFRRFDEAYVSIRKKITTACAVLNDRLEKIRHACVHAPHQIGPQLTLEIGFETSPESPNTHKNKRAMRERDVDFDGQTLCCEWHVKFHPTRDRLHFHFGAPHVAQGRPVICHFTEHFTT